MEANLLIKILLGLVIILAFLIFLFTFSPKKKSKKVVKKVQTKTSSKIRTDLQHLLSVVRNHKTSTQNLQEALNLIIKHHGKIHKKMGLRAHPDFDIYSQLFITICRHPNVNKHIIVNFDRELTKLNPDYKADINKALAKGLNARA